MSLFKVPSKDSLTDGQFISVDGPDGLNTGFLFDANTCTLFRRDNEILIPTNHGSTHIGSDKIPDATQDTPGLMSADDKARLDTLLQTRIGVLGFSGAGFSDDGGFLQGDIIFAAGSEFISLERLGNVIRWTVDSPIPLNCNIEECAQIFWIQDESDTASIRPPSCAGKMPGVTSYGELKVHVLPESTIFDPADPFTTLNKKLSSPTLIFKRYDDSISPGTAEFEMVLERRTNNTTLVGWSFTPGAGEFAECVWHMGDDNEGNEMRFELLPDSEPGLLGALLYKGHTLTRQMAVITGYASTVLTTNQYVVKKWSVSTAEPIGDEFIATNIWKYSNPENSPSALTNPRSLALDATEDLLEVGTLVELWEFQIQEINGERIVRSYFRTRPNLNTDTLWSLGATIRFGDLLTQRDEVTPGATGEITAHESNVSDIRLFERSIWGITGFEDNFLLDDDGLEVTIFPTTEGTIERFAGTGGSGDTGDGGLATAATFSIPQGIGVDSSGNVYICDSGNSRIRKIDTSGIISAFAGTGAVGSSGDGGLATDATFSAPRFITIDDINDKAYITDSGNHNVRVVDLVTGIITKFAGTTGSAGFSGDGGDANSAELDTPMGVAVDSSGSVYIADQGNERIRIVDTTGEIDTFAGTGAAGDTGDGGAATSATFDNPRGISIGLDGTIYIADQSNNKVRSISGGTINTFAGTGSAGFSGDGGDADAADLDTVIDVRADAYGNVYIADFGNNRVRRVDSNGTISTVVGSGSTGTGGDGGPADDAELTGPIGLTSDANGVLWVADNVERVVRDITFVLDSTVEFTDEPSGTTLNNQYVADIDPSLPGLRVFETDPTDDSERPVNIWHRGNHTNFIAKFKLGMPEASRYSPYDILLRAPIDSFDDLYLRVIRRGIFTTGAFAGMNYIIIKGASWKDLPPSGVVRILTGEFRNIIWKYSDKLGFPGWDDDGVTLVGAEAVVFPFDDDLVEGTTASTTGVDEETVAEPSLTTVVQLLHSDFSAPCLRVEFSVNQTPGDETVQVQFKAGILDVSEEYELDIDTPTAIAPTDNYVRGLRPGFAVSQIHTQAGFLRTGTEEVEAEPENFKVYAGGSIPIPVDGKDELWNELFIMFRDGALWVWWNGLLIPPSSEDSAELPTPVAVNTPYFPINWPITLGKVGLRMWPGAILRDIEIRDQLFRHNEFSFGQLELIDDITGSSGS